MYTSGQGYGAGASAGGRNPPPPSKPSPVPQSAVVPVTNHPPATATTGSAPSRGWGAGGGGAPSKPMRAIQQVAAMARKKADIEGPFCVIVPSQMTSVHWVRVGVSFTMFLCLILITVALADRGWGSTGSNDNSGITSSLQIGLWSYKYKTGVTDGDDEIAGPVDKEENGAHTLECGDEVPYNSNTVAITDNLCEALEASRALTFLAFFGSLAYLLAICSMALDIWNTDTTKGCAVMSAVFCFLMSFCAAGAGSAFVTGISSQDSDDFIGIDNMSASYCIDLLIASGVFGMGVAAFSINI